MWVADSGAEQYPVPRAAFCHSASVGSRRPAHRQYSRASNQEGSTAQGGHHNIGFRCAR
jgi:hypothetical protein